jgi:hypothetical protein
MARVIQKVADPCYKVMKFLRIKKKIVNDECMYFERLWVFNSFRREYYLRVKSAKPH